LRRGFVWERGLTLGSWAGQGRSRKILCAALEQAAGGIGSGWPHMVALNLDLFQTCMLHCVGDTDVSNVPCDMGVLSSIALGGLGGLRW